MGVRIYYINHEVCEGSAIYEAVSLVGMFRESMVEYPLLQAVANVARMSELTKRDCAKEMKTTNSCCWSKEPQARGSAKLSKLSEAYLRPGLRLGRKNAAMKRPIYPQTRQTHQG